MRTLLFLCLLVNWCYALPQSLREFQSRTTPVIGTNKDYRFFGTGWWLDNRTVCTAWHVVEEANPETIRVIIQDRPIHARIIAKDPQYDIVLLRPALSSPFLPVKFQLALDYLDSVVICGYAANIPNSQDRPAYIMAESRVAAFDVKSSLCPAGVLLTTTVFPGTSGSVVVTPSGAVAGLILGVQVEETSAWFATMTSSTKIVELIRQTSNAH